MKQHFRENFNKDWKEQTTIAKKNVLTEATKLVEANDGTKYTALSSYTVPVWRLGQKNLNNRIYSEELAQAVLKDFSNLVTVNLSDHPAEEGRVADILSIAKKPFIKDGILWVEAFIVDEEFDKKLNRMHDNGAMLGVSSSAYGELNEITRLIEIEGFEVERWFDWVLSPSYEVYVAKENNHSVTITESKEKVTNVIQEKKTMSRKSSMTLEEKNFHLGVSQKLKEAESLTDMKQKLQSYQDILEYCEGVEFASTVVDQTTAKINELTESLLKLAEDGKKVDSLKQEAEEAKKDAEDALDTAEVAVDSVEQAEKDADEAKKENAKLSAKFKKLKAQYETAVSMLDNFKLREGKLREMYELSVAEKNGMMDASEYVKLQKQYEAVLAEVKTLKESAMTYKSMARKYKEKLESVQSRPLPTRERQAVRPVRESAKSVQEESKPRRSYDGLSVGKYDENEYDFREVAEINAFYEDVKSSEPRVALIEKEIKSCKTLAEAESRYLNLKDLIVRTPNVYRKVEQKEKNIINPTFKATFAPRDGWV